MKIQPTNSDFSGNEPVLNALKIVEAQGLRQSLCIMGDLATGKDKVARDIYERKLKQNKIVEMLSWRRNCADVVGGNTIEDFFELPTCITHTTDVSIAGICDAKKEFLRKIDTIIIYEASTIPGQMLDIVDYILRTVRKGVTQYSDKIPFGGVQFIFIGDHFVYSPFTLEDTNGKRTPLKYFFESDSFKRLDPIFINLTVSCGNVEPSLLEMMRKIRVKENALAAYEQINAIVKHNKKFAPPYRMIILRSKEKVITLNKSIFKEVVTTTRSLTERELVMRPRFRYDIDDPCQQSIEPNRRDYQGGQIMFFCDDFNGLYRAGDLGYDVCIKRWHCSVKLESGEVIVVAPNEYTRRVRTKKIRDEIYKLEELTYRFPFNFSFAATMYKTHNMRFRFLEFQLGGKRMPGHLHIALTRCTSLKSLTFSNSFSVQDILVPDVVYEFDEMIRSEEQAIRLQEVLAGLSDYQ